MIVDMRLNFLVGLLLLFIYFGGSRVPSILAKNKQLLLGLFVGLLVGSMVIYEGSNCHEGIQNTGCGK
jgi:hypothetical protein